MRVAAVQLQSQDDVASNLLACERAIAEAANAGARFVVLPENFAYFGSSQGKRRCAESLSGPAGPIRGTLVRCATQYNIALLAGGWPESSHDSNRPFNSATVITEEGAIVANYRKIHLFDVTLPSGAELRESAAMTAGEEVVSCTVRDLRVGLSICYDIRFPELYRKLVDRGSELLCVPSAFTLETGRDHWHLLVRTRAIESQCWVVAANQCGIHPGNKTTFGHSLIVDPWGRVLAEAGTSPAVIIADLDGAVMRQVRSGLPSLRHRRIFD